MALPHLKKTISGWGLYPQAECELLRPERYRQLSALPPPVIARGLGRSYGDASLNSGHHVALTERINRLLAFDEHKGTLRCEAGTSLEEILAAFMPRGWFLPVTPGTKYATIGGCVAADVHGKNHHRDGSLADHINELQMTTYTGSFKKCSPENNSELFWATVGGMGLTGIIGEVSLNLRKIGSDFMKVRHYPAQNLDQMIDLLQDPAIDAPYSVAWLDCLSTGNELGRGVLMCGRHAPKEEAGQAKPSKKHYSLPFYFPSWALNSWTVRAFNTMYYAAQTRLQHEFLVDYDTYFYPLDRIGHWNRLYGKRGFLQYQFVVPEEGGREALRVILERFAASRRPSFLAVLKRFGMGNKGHLSFPMKGYTLALDLPVSDEGLFPFLDQLDHLVHHAGGRVYLAKDARLRPEMFRAMYPRYEEWLNIKEKADPHAMYQSDLSRRLRIGGRP